MDVIVRSGALAPGSRHYMYTHSSISEKCHCYNIDFVKHIDLTSVLSDSNASNTCQVIRKIAIKCITLLTLCDVWPCDDLHICSEAMAAVDGG